MTTARRSRIARPVPLLLAVCLTLVGACSSSGGGTGRATSTTPGSSAVSSTSVATSTTLALTPAGHTYGVGRADITLVDHSRDTPGDAENHVAPKQGRTLPTVVLYPTTDSHDDGTDDAHPVAPGRFPLFVFSHGVTASGPMYAGLLRRVAAAGYVVALPTFPLTAGPNGWSNLGQVVNQPADVSFVITELLKRSAAGEGPLGGHVSPDAVAVGGHSLGAITSLFFTNTCCRDDRVKAIVPISGMLFPAKSTSDSFDDPPRDVPLLMLHGEADPTVPYADGSKRIFTTFTQEPRALVSYPDTGHTDLLTKPSFMPTLVAFLDLTLRDDPRAWKEVGGEIATNGDGRIEVAGGLPQPD